MNRDVRKAVIGLLYQRFDVWFRNARNQRFIDTMGITPNTTVLDVGGTAAFWSKFSIVPKLTILNVKAAPEGCRFPYVQGSACALPFPDKSFDIVFSNSMIEHLGTQENQARAAQEMQRVGQRLWVQTPARSFPIDPHLLTPFVHWLPTAVQRKVMPYTVAGYLRKVSRAQVEELLHEFRLLNLGEVRALFPGCKIETETIAGLTKSLIAIRG